jgi:hypothetical protein
MLSFHLTSTITPTITPALQAIQRTWEMTKQGPIFKAADRALQQLHAWYVVLLQRVYGDKLDGAPNAPTKVAVTR